MDPDKLEDPPQFHSFFPVIKRADEPRANVFCTWRHFLLKLRCPDSEKVSGFLLSALEYAKTTNPPPPRPSYYEERVFCQNRKAEGLEDGVQHALLAIFRAPFYFKWCN